MQFRYGNFRSREHDNFAYKGGGITARRNQSGRLEAVIVTMDFEFTLVADGQAALNLRFGQIQNAIIHDGYDVGMYLDSGQPSRIFIRSAETSTGTRITKYPFPDPEIPGADYATSLKGSCSFSAEYLPPQFLGGGEGGGDNATLTSYRESVTVTGNGGPRTVVQEYDRGLPERFVVADRTKVVATQEGSAVYEADAANVYLDRTRPIWPNLLINESESTRKETVQLDEKRWQSTIAWNYQFESVGPLSANPNAR